MDIAWKSIFKLSGLGGGLLLGFGLVGMSLGLLYLVPQYIQPLVNPVYRTEHFAIHYRRDSQIARHIAAWGVRLEQEFSQALTALEVAPDKLSLPIEVLAADDRQRLAQEIQRRRNPYRGGLPGPFLGISAEQEIGGPLLEFLLRLSWGDTAHRLLRVGLVAALTQPPMEAAVAALPDKLAFTLTELLRWEKRGNFSAIISSLREHLQSDPVFPSEFLAQAHAATLVRFLMELGRLAKLRQLWKLSPFEEALRSVYGLTLGDLEERWRAWLDEQGRAAPDYSFYRGKYLAALGMRAEAERWLEGARASGDERATTELKRLRCEQGQIHRESLCACPWAARGTCFYKESANFVVHYSEDLEPDALKTLALAEASLEDIAQRLQLQREQLPAKLVIFLHAGAAPHFSATEALRGIVHLRVGEPVGYALALMAMRHWQKHQTYSEVLRRGLAYYLDGSGRDYLKEAERLSMTLDWVPLAALDFEAYKFESVRVGAATLVGYLLESRGLERLRELWTQTAPLGGDRSLDGALRAVYGLTRAGLERELIALWATEPKR